LEFIIDHNATRLLRLHFVKSQLKKKDYNKGRILACASILSMASCKLSDDDDDEVVTEKG
jgi:hypothetical protein